MFLADASALTVRTTDRTDLAWSALPTAPTVHDSRTTEHVADRARRAVRRVLAQPEHAGAPCATPVPH